MKQKGILDLIPSIPRKINDSGFTFSPSNPSRPIKIERSSAFFFLPLPDHGGAPVAVEANVEEQPPHLVIEHVPQNMIHEKETKADSKGCILTSFRLLVALPLRHNNSHGVLHQWRVPPVIRGLHNLPMSFMTAAAHY
jgi:hypothetical protein